MALINTTTTGVLGSTFYGDGSGDLTVQQNGVTVNKITSAPAFRVNLSGTQTLTTGTFTKLSFATEVFDTNNNFDSTTNYRFTPTVAGYYLIQGGLYIASATTLLSSIYKNGAEYSRGNQTSSYGQSSYAAGVIYLNGSTDYVELYAYQNIGSNNDVNSATFLTYFNGFLARAA